MKPGDWVVVVVLATAFVIGLAILAGLVLVEIL